MRLHSAIEQIFPSVGVDLSPPAIRPPEESKPSDGQLRLVRRSLRVHYRSISGTLTSTRDESLNAITGMRKGRDQDESQWCMAEADREFAIR
jgi:hypothetical protein